MRINRFIFIEQNENGGAHGDSEDSNAGDGRAAQEAHPSHARRFRADRLSADRHRLCRDRVGGHRNGRDGARRHVRPAPHDTRQRCGQGDARHPHRHDGHRGHDGRLWHRGWEKVHLAAHVGRRARLQLRRVPHGLGDLGDGRPDGEHAAGLVLHAGAENRYGCEGRGY